MDLRRRGGQSISITVVEPGLFQSGMMPGTSITKLLLTSRRRVAKRILSGALRGAATVRPPLSFALLTWGVCLLGRDIRYRLFARAKD